MATVCASRLVLFLLCAIHIHCRWELEGREKPTILGALPKIQLAKILLGHPDFPAFGKSDTRAAIIILKEERVAMLLHYFYE